jgi:TRAP-type transport system periplasmic protein
MRILTYIVTLIVLLTSCKESGDEPDYIFRFGHQGNEQDVWHRSAMYMSHLLDSLTKGRIELRVYPSEQLGVELDMIRSIRAEIADMTITGESMQNWTGITALLAVPYLIRDSDHLRQIVEGDIGRQISDEMINAIGIRPLCYFERGPRHLTSNRPIHSPDDLEGMILRVPNVPLFVRVWQSLGAKPTPMTFSEVFTALQQGTVDAQENPFALIYSAGFFEVQKYINLTRHVTSWTYVVVGEKQFQALPRDLQDIVLEAGKLTQQYHEREFLKQEKLLRQQLESKGVIFIEPDIEAFRQKANAAVMDALPEKYQSLYLEIIQLNSKDAANESDL